MAAELAERRARGSMLDEAPPASPFEAVWTSTQDEPQWDCTAKVVVVGEMGVGKTSLLQAFCRRVQQLGHVHGGDTFGSLNTLSSSSEDSFGGGAALDVSKTEPTIGVEFHTCIVDNPNFNKRVKLNFFDSAGHERFASIRQSFYKGSDAVLILVDIQKPDTFSSVESYLEAIHSSCDQPVLIGLVGNKADLNLEQGVRQAAEKVGNDLQQAYGLGFFALVSAKDQINIDFPFDRLVDHHLGQKSNQARTATLLLSDDDDDYDRLVPPTSDHASPGRAAPAPYVTPGCLSGLLPQSLVDFILCRPAPAQKK